MRVRGASGAPIRHGRYHAARPERARDLTVYKASTFSTAPSEREEALADGLEAQGVADHETVIGHATASARQPGLLQALGSKFRGGQRRIDQAAPRRRRRAAAASSG